MQSDVLIESIDTHTGGEPTRIITGGLNREVFEGGTVQEQRDKFAEEFDHLREFLLKEPRGHDDMFGAITVPPSRDDVDLGLFFMDNGGYLDMCGHGTMGVVTALIETGRLEAKSRLRIETPAGVVSARPEMSEDGRVDRVAVQNITSYIVDNVEVTLSLGGRTVVVPVDVVHAGNVFALVPASAVDLAVATENTDKFVELGLEIRRTINQEFDLRDPLSGKSTTVDITEFYESDNDADRNVVIFGEGQVDRSPCGSGTCAKMTLLHDKEELDLNERYQYESVIGTRFEGELQDHEDRDGIRVMTSEVAGSAYIVATHTFLRDPEDSVPGFSV
ncbi:proline racemase [Haloterrigena salina JCM 13891]|uniref:Proline racemase n=1 Tax=Haloterrigena salina JCM 13891 TaxID=1227488 RepID=M0BZL2_9EURY|nr:proline racemase family protein [Haloterrigena salina]ELZ15109.1 proline racemase [Haloterrigena salina JCM 13891]